MKVFKFGGASVKSADAVRNVAKIIEGNDNLVVVISAMGKTTNLMESLVKSYFNNDGKAAVFFTEFKTFHLNICTELFKNGAVPKSIISLFSELENRLQKMPSLDYNFEYDQFVGFGEMVSTRIVSEFLNSINLKNSWIDIRTCLRTNDNFRDASVEWQLTEKLMPQVFRFENEKLYITQGFIGSTTSNLTTTLGREGSDFTAAIIGNILNAENVSIWKDVPGVLNADPKKRKDAVKIDELSYREAIEMAYSGAQVIHPKTMKPLHNKQIPLLVKSFVAPAETGSVIHQIDHKLWLQPVFITKENQVLITISPIDFSFITIEDINEVVEILHKNRMKINLIQQSAIDFNLVIDCPEADLNKVLKKLSENYIARYNTGLTLHTIRHFNDDVIHKIKEGKKVFLEQNSRRTARLLTNQ
jgi:aspartate kinase